MKKIIPFLMAFCLSGIKADVVQTTHGDCSPALAHIQGDVSITCTDPKATAALERLQSEVNKLKKGQREKNEITRSQSEAIESLAQQKQHTDADASRSIDKVLDAVAEGRYEAADAALDDMRLTSEKDRKQPVDSQHSKQQAADTVASLSANAKDDDTVAHYRRKGAIWYASNAERALQAYRKVVELRPEDFTSWYHIGNLLKRMGELDEARDMYQKAIAYASAASSNVFVVLALDGIGAIYLLLGDAEGALASFQQASELIEASADSREIASSYQLLGVLYSYQGNLEQAEKYLSRARDVSIKADLKTILANNYNNLALVYARTGRKANAKKYFRKALKIFEQLKDQEGIARCNLYLGAFYRDNSDFKLAKRYFNLALDGYTWLGSKENIGQSYVLQDDVRRAKSEYLKVKSLRDEIEPDARKEKIQSVLEALNLAIGAKRQCLKQAQKAKTARLQSMREETKRMRQLFCETFGGRYRVVSLHYLQYQGDIL